MSNILDPTTADGAKVDNAFKALRMSHRPPEMSASFGGYRQGLMTGTMAAGLAANSEVLQFRYTGANVAVVNLVRFEGVAASLAFAAGQLSFRLLMATAWSADGSGGNALTTTGEAAQLDSRFAIPVATLRVATTAALTAGTKTLQGITANQQGLGMALGFTAPATPAVGAQMAPYDLLNASVYDSPQVLQANEGLVVVATVPATGTWLSGFTVSWIEMPLATWR